MKLHEIRVGKTYVAEIISGVSQRLHTVKILDVNLTRAIGLDTRNDNAVNCPEHTEFYPVDIAAQVEQEPMK